MSQTESEMLKEIADKIVRQSKNSKEKQDKKKQQQKKT
jgi:hypothetical protein